MICNFFRFFGNINKKLLFMIRNNCTSPTKVGTAMDNKTFETLTFDNTVLRRLPVDPDKVNRRRQVHAACFSLVNPEPVVNPRIMAFSESAMGLIDLGASELIRADSAEYLSGNKIMPGSETASHCYCGHQFGVFAGQLGDGAAIYLGEVVNGRGERWEIQLKGAGPTPYSRSADGRKVIRSSIREFLCSEAIHHLGIGTTRAGSVVTCDDTVIRDIFYTGRAIKENCAIVLRLASTFLRFGSFEIFKPTDPMSGMEGPSVGKIDILRTMLDYTAETLYPQIWSAHQGKPDVIYLEMYREIVKRTARLVAQWQCVGWVHGVLNTDNMSIVGLTIDYGPFGFMDAFNPGHVSNTSDNQRRYSYKEQPAICRWNCEKLAEAWKDIVPLETTKRILEDVYDAEYTSTYQELLHKKFGLSKTLQEDSKLFEDFFSTMGRSGADFTNSFRCLSRVPLPTMPQFPQQLQEVEDYLVSQCQTLDEIKQDSTARLPDAQLQMLAMLARSDPRMLALFPGGAELLNEELSRLEIAKEIKDMTDESKTAKDRELWHDWLMRYVDRLKLEHADINERVYQERMETMKMHNPRVVLRNYLAQNAIVAAEQGHYAELKKLLRVLENPFAETVDLSDLETDDSPSGDCSSGTCPWKIYRKITDYGQKPPSWSRNIKVSCSS